MINRERIRAITGYTHQQQMADATAWHNGAVSFYKAAEILHEHKERIPTGIRVFVFNAAMSIELILKSILVRKKISLLEMHNLRELAKEGEVNLDDNQKITLDLLTEHIVWAGKYPVPKKANKWDEYHDTIIEKHIVRTSAGNKHSTFANPRTFPSWENYKKIWDVCDKEYGSTAPSP